MNLAITTATFDKVLTRKSEIRVIPYAEEFRAQAVEIAREMHAHSIYKNMPLDEEKTIHQLSAAGTSRVPERFFRLAVRGNELLGGFYGFVATTFFCDEKFAQDMGWWVKKSARGGMAAVLLLAAFEEWAKDQGANKIMIGQSTDVNIATTTKLFMRCGYRVIGYNTVKDV